MSAERDGPSSGQPRTVARHWGGFLASGLLAFAVDAAMLEIGVRLLALDPLVARLAAISLAMVAGWLAHRRWTFAVIEQPTLGEFFRYAAAGWMSAIVNYAAFALMLVLMPTINRLAALVIASALAMILSYVTMRYAVFRRAGELQI